MKLKKLGTNQTEITLANGAQVLFSYSTPVAAWIDGQFYKTEQQYSKTTSRHVNAWTHCAVSKPQEFFNQLVRA